MLFIKRHITKPQKMADRVRFELTSHSHDWRYSKPLHLPTLSPIRWRSVKDLNLWTTYVIVCLVGRCIQPLYQHSIVYTLFTLEVRETAKSKIWPLIHIHFANFSVKWNCGMPYISNQPIIHFTLKSRLKESKRKKTFKQLLSMKWHLLLD